MTGPDPDRPDGLDALRAAVRSASGAARTRPLLVLAQALTDRYRRCVPGSARARPALDEAIEALDEACRRLESAGFPHGVQAGLLGWLLGVRHLAHGGPADDRERGIVLLERALGSTQPPPTLRRVFRAVRTQLGISGALVPGRLPFGEGGVLVDHLATLDPSEWPVTVVEGPAPAAPAPPPARPAAPPREHASTLRAALLDAVPGHGIGGLVELLGRDGSDLDPRTVDDLVALATVLVDAPGTLRTDRLLLAAALCLRDAVDAGGGWGADDIGDDLRAATENLLASGVTAEPVDTAALADLAAGVAAALEAHPPRP